MKILDFSFINSFVYFKSGSKKINNLVKVDLIIIGISALVLMGLVGYARPLVISPIDQYRSVNGEVLFNFTRADVLLIDDNKDFTTPDRYSVVDGQIVRLEPGVYYWKVSGVLGPKGMTLLVPSEVRKLTIQSSVELKLVKLKNGFGVVNAGNVRLNVDVYDGDKFIEKKKLGIGEVSRNGSKFVGSQDE